MPGNDGTVKIGTELDESGVKKGLSGLGGLAKTGLTALAGGVAAVGASAGAIGKFAFDVGSSFEAAGSQIAATMGTTTDNIQDILDEAARLGKETSFSATQAAEGFNILAQSGLTAEEQISAMGDVLNLAAAGSLSLDAAASYTTGAVKGFADSMDNANYYTDMIAKGATLANTSVDGLGAALSDSAATASAYGQRADRTTVALLRLAEQGVTGSAASTALAAAMKNIYTPTDKARDALEKLGVSAYDEAGNARDFNKVVDELSGALSAMSDEEANAYKQSIFGIQGLDAFNKMTVTSTEKTNAWMQELVHASDGIGAAAEQSKTMLDNLQGDLTTMQSAAEGFGVAVYDGMQGPLRELVQYGTEALGQLTTAFQEDGVEGLVNAGASILTDVLTGMVNHLPDVVDMAINVIDTLLAGVEDHLPEIIESGTKLVTSLVNGAMRLLPRIVSLAGNVMLTLAQSLISNLPQIVQSAVQMVLSFVNTVANNFPQIISTAAKLIGELAKGLIQSIPTVVGAIPQIIAAIIRAITSTNWGEVGSNIIQGIASGIGNGVSAIADAARSAASAALNAAKRFLGIASPSRVMRDIIGKNMMLGAAEGVDEETPEFVGSTVDAASAAVSAMQAAAYRSSDAAGEAVADAGLRGRAGDTGNSPDGRDKRITIEVPVNIDGREVARSTATYMSQQMAWEG